MSRVIVVTSGKGGVGKSTISANLAVSLANQKMKVCLIDADLGLKNLDVILGLENRVVYDLKDAIDGVCPIEKVLVKDKRCHNLFLLPACRSLDFQKIKVEDMQYIVKQLDQQFDFIILDSPAGVEKGFSYAIKSANEALVVINLDLSSIRDADRVIGLLSKEGIFDVKLIINKVNQNLISSGRSLTIDDALNVLAIPLVGIVYDDEQIVESNNRATPIAYDNRTNSYQYFNNIALRLQGNEVNFAKPKRKSLLQKIFS